MYSAYVKLPKPDAPLPPIIEDNTKLWPFFKDCMGAIDGTHIYAGVSPSDRARYRNRKNEVSQNVLAVCDFNMCFTYVLSGWEGSAADGAVLEDARSKDFRVPDGKYYLGDAGFPSTDALLVPYRGVRYHLREWGVVSVRQVVMHKSESNYILNSV